MKKNTETSSTRQKEYTSSLSAIVEYTLQQAHGGDKEALKALTLDVLRGIKVKRFLREVGSTYEECMETELTHVLNSPKHLNMFQGIWDDLLPQMSGWEIKDLFLQAWNNRDLVGVEKIMLWEAGQQSKAGLYLWGSVYAPLVEEHWWKRQYQEDEAVQQSFLHQMSHTLIKWTKTIHEISPQDSQQEEGSAYVRVARNMISSIAFQILKMDGNVATLNWLNQIPKELRPNATQWVCAAENETAPAKINGWGINESGTALSVENIVEFTRCRLKECDSKGVVVSRAESEIYEALINNTLTAIAEKSSNSEETGTTQSSNLKKVLAWQRGQLTQGKKGIASSRWKEITFQLLCCVLDKGARSEQTWLEQLATEYLKSIPKNETGPFLLTLRARMCKDCDEEQKNDWDARALKLTTTLPDGKSLLSKRSKAL